jgi:hypothetical protein
VSIQAHQDIVKKLVDLIGITSIMEVSCRSPLYIASGIELLTYVFIHIKLQVYAICNLCACVFFWSIKYYMDLYASDVNCLYD